MTAPADPDRTAAERSTVDLLQTLTEDLRRLVQEEVRGARDELAGTARRAARGGGLLGGAAAFGVLAGGSSAVIVLRVLDRYLPPVAASAAAMTLWGTAAVALARAGVAELRRAGPLLPQRTAENLRADVEAVSAAAGGTR
jgi:Putative Actinobacterial Holin-X, holin superfamily III